MIGGGTVKPAGRVITQKMLTPRVPAAPKPTAAVGAPLMAARQAAKTAQSTAQRSGSQSYSENSSTGGGYDANYGAAVGGAAAPMGEQDWLAAGGDSAYQAQMAALQADLQRRTADIGTQKTRYDTDYGTSIKSLGWKDQDQNWDTADDGEWEQNDVNTASGRGFQNQLNDYAARGKVQSSDYATALQNLWNNLNEQRTSMFGSRSTFRSDLDSQLAAAKEENANSGRNAGIEALARYAAGLSL